MSTRRSVPPLVAAAAIAAAAPADVLYVDDDADAGGNSLCPLCDEAAGDVLTVPAEYATIQTAVDAACDGAEVIVGPGTYPESVNFGGKAIVVRSSHGAEATTIDAQGTGRTVLFGSAETRSSVLDGFTVTGGGVFTLVASPTVRNCRMIGNTSADEGVGIYVNVGSPQIVNCTGTANTAGERGGGIRNRGTGTAIRNCIVRGNSPGDLDGSTAYTATSYSNVQGGWPGAGNIDADPLFVDAASGNLRLQPDSPCVDAGHNWAVAGLAEADLDGSPRFADGPAADTGCGLPVVVDLEAYEHQGVPSPVVVGDIDGNGAVTVNDFLLLQADWGPCAGDCCLADLDASGDVGVNDFLILLAHWG